MKKRWKCITALSLAVLFVALVPMGSMHAETETPADEAVEAETAGIITTDNISADEPTDLQVEETADLNGTLSDEAADTADSGITEQENVFYDSIDVRPKRPHKKSSKSEAPDEESSEPEMPDEENGELEAPDENGGESETPGDSAEDSKDDNETLGNDSGGSEGDHMRPAKITETDPYYMYTDSPCLLGDGEWVIYGEPTAYYGGITFYATQEGIHFFVNDKDWEMFGIDVEPVNE